MRNRILTAICLTAAAAGLAPAQSTTAVFQVPRTAWGHPDLQDTWTSDDLQGVPVERPKEFGTRRFLTEQELAERAGSVDRQNDAIETGVRPTEGVGSPGTELEFAL